MKSKSYTLHQNYKCLRFLISACSHDYISLFDHDMNYYILKFAFLSVETSKMSMIVSFLVLLSYIIVKQIYDYSWSTIKHIVDKVHGHVCGNSTYSDVNVLLIRNHFWDEALDKCPGCHRTALSQATRKVSPSFLRSTFNAFICIDHFYLANVCLLHAIAPVTRYSSCANLFIVSSAYAILCFEFYWLGHFWTPNAVLGGHAINLDEDRTYLSSLHIGLEPIRPRRHNNNVLESKYSVICSIFLCMTL